MTARDSTGEARYLQPGEAAWKHILDNFILRNKAGTKVQYPEGRAIVALNLTQAQKKAILDRMPTKALYWKECLTAFWKLKMVPEHYGWKACANESPWHGYRTEHIRRGLSFKDIQYFKSTLKVLQFADFFNKDNNKRFTRQEWRKFVDRMERAQSGGRRPIPGLQVHMLTPYYVHTLHDHQKKKRPEPQCTYANALLRTHPTKPPEEEKTPASRYLR